MPRFELSEDEQQEIISQINILEEKQSPLENHLEKLNNLKKSLLNTKLIPMENFMEHKVIV